ncbi:hypothetical protein GSI_09603 [Ganoderma sinense ZZ0214-1]|uniref:Uncharacterized protein n=1 Tax=Ganoderma sinense ZZ0214-1 TaxID=1077348 RepID=A0A2G8S3K2_9APHY|nr:hypothetical protein GSI_09603 [Ganoderma sinense ZZ0214-1]
MLTTASQSATRTSGYSPSNSPCTPPLIPPFLEALRHRAAHQRSLRDLQARVPTFDVQPTWRVTRRPGPPLTNLKVKLKREKAKEKMKGPGEEEDALALGRQASARRSDQNASGKTKLRASRWRPYGRT